MDGKSAVYFGETGCNMHKRVKEHLTKFRSKKKDIRESSAFFKHIENEHGGLQENKDFESYFPKVNIVKAYKKVLNRSIEEGTFMINHNGEVLNSKTEWNQPRIIRTTIVQGGAEMVGGRVLPFQRDGGGRTGGERTAAAGQQGRETEGGGAGSHRSLEQLARPEVGERGRTADPVTARARRLAARTSG